MVTNILRIPLNSTNAPAFMVFVYYVCYFALVPLVGQDPGAPLPVDKIAAVALAPYAYLGIVKALRHRKLFLFAGAGYFICLLGSSAMRLCLHGKIPYPWLAPLLGIVGDIKPFIFGFALYQILDRKNTDSEKAILNVMRVYLWLAIGNSLFALRDILIGGSSIWGIPLHRAANGIVMPLGLFNHKSPCACLTMIGALSCLGLLRERFSLERLCALPWLLALIALSGAAKEGIAVFIGIAIFVFIPSGRSTMRNFKQRVLIALIFLPLVIVLSAAVSSLFSQRVHDYGEEASVRVALHVTSFEIAKDSFPFGSGAGTFASTPSRSTLYSPLYYQYNIFTMFGGGPYDGSYLQDVWWPHVLAEGGFIGCACYLLVALLPVKLHFFRMRAVGGGSSFFLITAALALVITSVAAPTFTMDSLLPLIGVVWGASLMSTKESPLSA
jgi:hypothetical protein